MLRSLCAATVLSKPGADIITRLRADPGALSFAVAASLGGANHIATVLAMKAAGIDVKKLKFVVFNSGVQSQTAVMGGHVDIAAVPLSGVVAQLERAACESWQCRHQSAREERSPACQHGRSKGSMPYFRAGVALSARKT